MITRQKHAEARNCNREKVKTLKKGERRTKPERHKTEVELAKKRKESFLMCKYKKGKAKGNSAVLQREV